MNAVTVAGDAVGEILLSGHGAGMRPTASAVVSDIVDLARNLMAGVAGRVPMLGCQTDQVLKIPVMPVEELSTHYYFRFSALVSGLQAVLAGPRGGSYKLHGKSHARHIWVHALIG